MSKTCYVVLASDFSVMWDYGNGFISKMTANADLDPTWTAHECIMSPGEFITGIITHTVILWKKFPVLAGITFVTTHKTCGHYGQVSDNKNEAWGHMLLYVNAKTGGGFDKLEFIFDFC